MRARPAAADTGDGHTGQRRSTHAVQRVPSPAPEASALAYDASTNELRCAKFR